jgi:HK97 family phage major capsid protein
MADEQRTIDVDVQDLETRGRTVHGFAAVYGALSADLGGFRERIAPGAFASALEGADVRCLLNHDPSQVLGRTRSGTLRLHDEQRGLRFECDLPDSPLGVNVREAVRRGDVDGASFRFVCGEESWEGDTRTVESIRELRDVTVATYAAYPEASVELRTRPGNDPAPEGGEEEPTMEPDREPAGEGLAVEDRAAAADTPTLETRVLDAMRSVRRGENRDLTTTTAEPIAPPELSTFLWDRLRPASIALASGIRVIPTDREKVVWPRLTGDVDPGWIDEATEIPPGDPAFGTLEAEPTKLAHLVQVSNEVLDDSEPSVLEVLNAHLATMLALKLDAAIYEGSGSAPVIRGLKNVSGIQTVDMGTNGAALTDYDPLVEAVGKLRAANVPPPYAIAMNPRTLTELELLKEGTDFNTQLARPEGLPPVYTSSQLSVTETKGTANNASSAYVYAPAEVVLVRRQDATIELDRSRLFNSDQSEIRGKMRCDLIVPNPVAVCRVVGIIPPS